MSDMALAAAMRPKSAGSSTIGMKKSVVAITHVSPSSIHTAASSLVSVPTRRRGKAVATGEFDRICCRTAGASLHPHPPPCARLVSRMCGDVAIALIPSTRRNTGEREMAQIPVHELRRTDEKKVLSREGQVVAGLHLHEAIANRGGLFDAATFGEHGAECRKRPIRGVLLPHGCTHEVFGFLEPVQAIQRDTAHVVEGPKVRILRA